MRAHGECAGRSLDRPKRPACVVYTNPSEFKGDDSHRSTDPVLAPDPLRGSLLRSVPSARFYLMPSRAAAVSLLAAALTLAACSSNRQPDRASSQLDFGVDMARRGLWHEALFRFEAAERLDPNNARIQSDLGVAYEAAGQFDKALSYYQKALKLDPNDKGIRTNYSRFVEFYQ